MVPTRGSTLGTSRSSRWRSTGEIARAQGWWWRGSRASRKAPDCAQQHPRVAACAFCRAQSSYLTCVCWPGLSDVRQPSCVSCPACHCSNPPAFFSHNSRRSPSKWGKKRQRRWGTPSAGAPQGCSLSDLPESVRLAILSYTGGCIELARLCTVCKWWLDLHRKAAKHVDIRWSQWEQSDANPNAICLALPSYPRLVSVDIVADAPSTQHSCRTLPDPVDPRGPPTLVIGTCQALEALWEHASIRTLTLRTSPRVVSGGKHAYQSVYHAGRPANGGVKETGAVWMLDREFTRVVSRSRTLKNLDFRRSRFDQIPGWPASMETLCMQQCAQLQVFPGGTLRSLVSLDLSRCPLLHDISVLVGATKLHWLDLSGCSALSEISPIAGCAELETLNLNRCFNLREISALGTLKKLATLDMSSCPEVEGIGALASCTALARLDISHTHVPAVSCLAPVKRPDETHHQGCPQLAALTCRGCKCLDASVSRTRALSLAPALRWGLARRTSLSCTSRCRVFFWTPTPTWARHLLAPRPSWPTA